MGLSKIAGDIVLTTKKYSPEIKFIFGVFSLGAALYTTHKAALKSQQIVARKKELEQTIEEAKEMVETGEIPEEEYTKEDVKLDIRKKNFEYVTSMAKNYALPALCTGVSIWLFHGAVMDYKNLFVGMGAAYNALMVKYNDKMAFYKKELGKEKFDELEEGFKTNQIVRAQSTGLTDPEEKEAQRKKENPYSRFFDEDHPDWTGNPEVDKYWLLIHQNLLDEKLQRVGYLFLNDAYLACGYAETDAGRVMGWVRDNPDGTINHVDFGIFNINNRASRWFVNGLEPIFLIDFNVDPSPITGRTGWKTY